MKVDRVRIYRMRRDATRLVGGSDCLTDQKLSRALGKTIVDRGSPFFMLRFQLDESSREKTGNFHVWALRRRQGGAKYGSRSN